MHCKLSVRLTCSVIYIFMTLVRLSSSSLGTLAWVTTSRSLRWRYGPSWQPLCSCLMIWGTFVLAPRGCCRTDTSLPSIRTRWAIKDTSLPRWVRRDMEWQLSAFIVHLVSVWRGAQSPDDKSILTRSEPLLHFGLFMCGRTCSLAAFLSDTRTGLLVNSKKSSIFKLEVPQITGINNTTFYTDIVLGIHTQYHGNKPMPFKLLISILASSLVAGHQWHKKEQ